MELSSLQLSWANVTAVAIAAALSGAVIWFLIRKRQNRVWLPTIRIIEFESRLLPKLQWQMPPIVPFITFLIAAFAVVWFSLSPTRLFFSSSKPDERRYHIFLDLSPSVSAHKTWEEYGREFSELWGTLVKSGRVSISSSANTEFVTPNSLAEAKAFFETLSFHRAGVRLGAALNEQWETLGKVDQLFIASDADLHSWGDLNWQFLSNDVDVLFVDLRNNKVRSNTYINSTTFAAAMGAEMMDWDVELIRNHAEEEERGVVTVMIGSRQLGSNNYTIPAGHMRQLVRISWPSRDQDEFVGGEEQTLVFRITPEQQDAIQMDNQMRTQLRGQKQNALLIAEPAGEMHLEDPTHHLQKSLQVLDFRLKRLDTVAQPGPEATSFPLWLLVGGGTGISRFCPQSIEAARLGVNGASGSQGFIQPTLPTVWLIPEGIDANYQELCWCYARLAASSEPLTTMPSYCQDVVTRDRYAGVLGSLGAQQIGGTLDDVTGALAFRSFDESSGLQVVAFTLPLTPLKATGVNHAALPVLVKDLLELQGLIAPSNGRAKEEWPRISDIVAARKQMVDPKLLALVRDSNVPVGESMMQSRAVADLPPRWVASPSFGSDHLHGRKDQSDPIPWIIFCAGLIIVALVTEALFIGFGMIHNALRMVLFGLTFVSLTTDFAQAEITLNLLGYRNAEYQFRNLSEDVAMRTSIDLKSKPAMFSGYSQTLIFEPWLWVQGIQPILSVNGNLNPDILSWIKRGGFLVIEDDQDSSQFKKLSAQFSGPDSTDVGWQPIPPDHELMRSFHLLDSLPVCQNQIWQGFHFDGRLAILVVPFRFLDSLKDNPLQPVCKNRLEREQAVRVFVNLLMVVLATDYKKDQIHLPEILKRLR